jgi:hypothetical protein
MAKKIHVLTETGALSFFGSDPQETYCGRATDEGAKADGLTSEGLPKYRLPDYTKTAYGDPRLCGVCVKRDVSLWLMEHSDSEKDAIRAKLDAAKEVH